MRVSSHLPPNSVLLQKFEDEWGPMMTINFVLLQSPLLTPHDPETSHREP
jgi:hypothetical protein